MTVFERPGDRVVVLLSSGALAGTQAIISVLKQQAEKDDGKPTIWNARTMFDVASVVSDATREVERRDAARPGAHAFNASFIFGGQIAGERPRLFRTYAETNFIEAESDSPFLQTGETKYGKPILDRVVTRNTSLSDATKCVLLSFDSTMRSNLSVGLPIDLLCYEPESLRVTRKRRLEQGDAYFTELRSAWSEGVREVFTRLPEPTW
jgi:putative proteasome-type protease